MANPQTENGYTKIANEILDKLIQIKINTDALKMVLFIIRKTYGFNKTQDKISLSQFVLATQLKKSVICRGLNRLNNMNIIIRIANGECNIYRFNKDFDTWKPLAKLLTLAKQQMVVSQTANELLAKQRHTKEIDTKETITKETKLPNGSVLLKGNNYKPDHKPPKRKKVILTDKQKIAVKRMRALSYFHDKGVENGFEYLLEEDDQANRKFIGLARAFERRYPENWRQVIDWWFETDNAWCDYHPSNFFSINNYMKFDNKSNNPKSSSHGILR